MSVSASKKQLKNHENGPFFGDFPKKTDQRPKTREIGQRDVLDERIYPKEYRSKAFCSSYQLLFCSDEILK